MYKIVIIDNEIEHVKTLRDNIPWAELDCVVSEVAHNLSSGKDAIKKHNPHILISDLVFDDGDLLDAFDKNDDCCRRIKTMVITKSKSFDDAKKALNMGVLRFLTKPVVISEVIEAIELMSVVITNIKKCNPQDDEDHVGSFLVREAMDYIHHNCHQKLSLSDVADACYVSQWHLSKLLSKNIGQSFYDMLNAARIKRSKVLLEYPKLRIGEIAQKVGYSDTPHFSRVFKRLEGISPNEYRNSKLV